MTKRSHAGLRLVTLVPALALVLLIGCDNSAAPGAAGTIVTGVGMAGCRSGLRLLADVETAGSVTGAGGSDDGTTHTGGGGGGDDGSGGARGGEDGVGGAAPPGGGTTCSSWWPRRRGWPMQRRGSAGDRRWRGAPAAAALPINPTPVAWAPAGQAAACSPTTCNSGHGNGGCDNGGDGDGEGGDDVGAPCLTNWRGLPAGSSLREHPWRVVLQEARLGGPPGGGARAMTVGGNAQDGCSSGARRDRDRPASLRRAIRRHPRRHHRFPCGRLPARGQ